MISYVRFSTEGRVRPAKVFLAELRRFEDHTVEKRTNTMLATLSLGLSLVLPHLQPTPATMRSTAHARMPPPAAMLTRDTAAPRRLPRICLTPEAVRAATPPYAAAAPYTSH